MEKFFNEFLGKGLVYSLDKLIINVDENVEHNAIKFIKIVIFKHDVLVEFKHILNSAFSSESPVIKNDSIKVLIKKLSVLIQSNENIKIKSDVCNCVFRAFVLSCKEEEMKSVVQFFILLTQLMGFSVNSKEESDKCVSDISSENLKSLFDVEVLPPSLDSFTILKELLLNLSKTKIYLNSDELQPYSKWLQKLMKTLASTKPFLNVIMELFSIGADIDLKIIEGNLDVIFSSIFTQEQLDNDFQNVYSVFLEHIFSVCVKFQRTVKFIGKFLSSIKVCSSNLTTDTILPSNVTAEFSKTVAIVLSNQQSLLLFDLLIQSLSECVNFLVEEQEFHPLVLLVTKKLLVCFLQEVKLFAPSIAATTLQTLISKLNDLKEILQKFGNCVFNNKKTLKNENVTETYLTLCFYCGEIESLINCYKESVLLASNENPALDCDWQSCISAQQWNKLVGLVLKSKLENCGEICFHLALQKLRTCQLEQSPTEVDESTIKLIFYQLTSDLCKFNIIQNLSPDNLKILLEILTTKQSKAIIKNILKQILQNDNEEEWKTWMSHLIIQENQFFIVCLFSEILKKSDTILEGVRENVSWFSEDYFTKENSVREECVESLPEKVNTLLRNSKKLRKSFGKMSDGEWVKTLSKLFDVFKSLPLPYMKDGFKRLGLSFAVGVGTLVSDLVFDSILKFLSFDADPSVCFDVGLCIKWLSELSHNDGNSCELKNKVIESLVRNCPNTKFGLSQMGDLIDSTEGMKKSSPVKALETRILLYNELGKCWQRGKKRKSDNDLIGSYRVKLAKVICDGGKEFEDADINSENCKILFKIFSIELNKAVKGNEEKEMEALGKGKLPSYFEFAVRNLKREFDESSASFLAVVLQAMPQCRKYLAEDSLLDIWEHLKTYGKVNWRFFCSHGSDEEFKKILDDLFKMSKEYLTSESAKEGFNCFEIWSSFFAFSSDTKKKLCQLKLLEFFNFLHDCDSSLGNLSVKRKISLVKFLIFCVNGKEVIVTSDILDTVFHVLVQCAEEGESVEEFEKLFAVEVEAASAILLRQFAWSRSKVHLSFLVFKRLSGALMKKCDAAQEMTAEDVVKLSTCGFFLEKWVSLMVRKDKDFARISAYFLTTLVSFIASVTVLPAVKIHLSNCINHFLSISDSHTVSYLMRLLKPGYQQVFSTVHEQFKKYHKYSGKI